MINTDIYGSSDTWPAVVGVDESAPSEQKYYFANFGNNTSYDISTLKAGIDNGRIELNTPIDKSLSWCGLGNTSAFSNLEFYNAKNGDEFEMINKDSRTITNFALFAPATQWTLANPVVSNWYYADKGNFHYGNRARWSPNATDGETSTTGNYNMGLKPIVQMPMRNCVFVPVLKVRKRVDTITEVDVDNRTVYMWDYLNTNNEVNYTTHSYITTVGMYYYGTIDGLTATTINKRTSLLTSTTKRLAVTDLISAGKGIPFDINVPSAIQAESTHYYAFGRPFAASSTNPAPGTVIFGMLATNSDYMILYDNTTSYDYQAKGYIVLPHPNGQISTPDNIRKLYYVQYYDGFQEWVRQQIACFGMFFTDDKDTAETGDFDSELMYLGTLVDGVGHGDYTSGEANRSQPQWQWDTTNDSDYDPFNPPEIDDNIYGRPWGFNPVSLADSTVRRYVMDDAALQAFGNNLWDIIDTTDPDELIQNQTLTNFLTNNPLDCVISLKRFPFADMSTASAVNIVIGKVRVSAAGKPFAADSTIKSCGIKHVYRRFKDFQWQNYLCEYFLYLPFCGTLQLDPETVIGRDLKVYYAIDYTTGTCTAFVTTFDDDGAECYLDSASGNLAIDVALTGVETATLTGQIYNANENLKLTKFNQALGYVKSGMDVAGSASKVKYNPTGLFNSALDLGQDIANNLVSNKNAEWNINNTQIPLKMIGASSGCNAFQGELRPCLIVHYPITVSGFNKDAYLHTVGAACCESGLIGSYSGYVEVSNVDLSGFRATATEKNMIISALSAGVYI